MIRITKEFKFEMAHALHGYDGLCKNIHGHSYRMIVEFEGELDEQGMVIDFYDVEKIKISLSEQNIFMSIDQTTN